MTLVGHVAFKGDIRGAFRVLIGRSAVREPLEGGRVILKWVFKKRDGETWTGLKRLRIGKGGGLL